MNVGLYLSAQPTSGGVYQYSRMVLHSLEHFGEADVNYYALYNDACWEGPLVACQRIVPYRLPVDVGARFWEDLRLGGVGAVRRKILRRLCYWRLLDPSRVTIQRELRALLHRIPLDLIIYACGTPAAFEIGIPYIFTVPDLLHRVQSDNPDFREQLKSRDYMYEWGTKYAMAIWSLSEMEKGDVMRFYGVDGRKIRVLPPLPWATMLAATNHGSPELVAERYNLPKGFLFYPAQFWSGKNHVRLVSAIDQIRRRRGVSIPLVLTGSPKAAFRETMDLINSLGLHEQVRYLGFVSDNEVAALYKLATGLVLPTFQGPTNIPPLEAFAAGCPVLVSELRGVKEQLGDAAVYVDPSDVSDIAEKLYQLYTDEALRNRLVAAGYRIASRYTLRDFAGIVNETVRDCVTTLPKRKSLGLTERG